MPSSLGIVASGYMVPAGGGGSGTFTNHAAIATPRVGGSSQHTVDPNGGTVAAGTNFVPTAGRLLVLVIEGSVTSTSPSPTWILPSGGSAVNNTGLYVYYRTAVGGGDTVTFTHNAANYPVMFHWFEFAAGSTFVASVAATAANMTAANPNLTGLTGTNWVAAAKATTAAALTTGCSATWPGPNVEVLDSYSPFATTDGYWLGIGYQAGYTSASYQPTCTVAKLSGVDSFEALTFAVNAA